MKNLSKTILSLLGLTGLIVITLVGCSTPRTYAQGGEIGKGDLIKVTCDSEHNRATITKLDGELLGSVSSQAAAILFTPARGGGVDIVYVKPGRHEMTIYWKEASRYANSYLWFVAETGKSYVVRAKANNDRALFKYGTFLFWIEEAETGKHVGGIVEQ